MAVGFQLVNEYGPMHASVTFEVSLAVAVDVEPPHHPAPKHRLFENSGAYRSPAPRLLAR
jgi:hypothetical protein